MDLDFLISEGIFVRGRAIDSLEHVSLWLGANTIVELTFAEALELLKNNLGNADSSLSQVTEELAYIKDQKTTTEVNVARVYNHSLALKREQQIARSK
jgi:prefoldin subunit 5